MPASGKGWPTTIPSAGIRGKCLPSSAPKIYCETEVSRRFLLFWKSAYMSDSFSPNKAFYLLKSNVRGSSKDMFDISLAVPGHLDVAKRVDLEYAIFRIICQALAIRRLQIFQDLCAAAVPRNSETGRMMEGWSPVITSQGELSAADFRSIAGKDALGSPVSLTDKYKSIVNMTLTLRRGRLCSCCTRARLAR